MAEIRIPKKLIEVALPLDDINFAAAKEKSIRQGHPSTLHLWWARRPLAAARAVIFSQMVNDPGYQDGDGFKYGVNKKDAEIRREKLFDLIRDLVKWENINDDKLLERANDAIRSSWIDICELNKNHTQAKTLFNPNKVPKLHDPFAGGGAIPIESQRLGIDTSSSDLNPVAVVLNKAMIEIPPRFSGVTPIGPIGLSEKQKGLLERWDRALGLAEDVKRYGTWMHEKCAQELSELYPPIEISNELVGARNDLSAVLGQKLPVIAWIWARTVKSPNPAFSNVYVPLVRSFALCTKRDKEAWIDIIKSSDGYTFEVKLGKQPKEAIQNTVGRSGGRCILSETAMPLSYIRSEGKAGRMGRRLMAIVVQGPKGRIYLSPTDEIESVANNVSSDWRPEVPLPENTRDFKTPNYGLNTFADLFTSRQLVALTRLSDLVDEVKSKVYKDALSADFPDDDRSLAEGGVGRQAYSEAIAVYLGIASSKAADYNSTICGWINKGETIRNTFGRQAIPMVWDYCEANIIGDSTGSFFSVIKQMVKAIENASARSNASIIQHDAQTVDLENKVISTDPPYYDNIGYADLSDFFYLWLRRSLRPIYPNLFSTMAVPKVEELVATPYRHGGIDEAEKFFLSGMTKAMGNMANQSHPAFPVTIYYAFKQSDTNDSGTSNTGWETFLAAVIDSGLSIDGTWPMNTERGARTIGIDSNALASSIILVCHKRKDGVGSITRREFIKELKETMPEALETMIGGSEGVSPIAPVDLAQAAIGPGMSIYSKYDSVLNQDGTVMSVHDSLILINRAITEFLNPDSGNFDADTLFCDDWFSQFGWGQGQFGEADTLARAKGTTVDGVKDAGVIQSGQGKVQLYKWNEYPADWNPQTDSRMPIWEACHHMIRELNQNGESGAGSLLARMPDRGEQIRQLAYHLYTLCERKNWAEDARAYNELIGSWHAIVAASHEAGHREEQIGLEL